MMQQENPADEKDNRQYDTCYQSLFRQSPIAGLVVDVNGQVLEYNREAVHLLVLNEQPDNRRTGAWTAGSLSMQGFVDREDISAMMEFLAAIFRDNRQQPLDIRLRRCDQTGFLARLSGVKLDNQNHLAQITIFDVDHDQRNGEAINLLAYYDQLTGLPNRHLLFDRLHWAIRDARRQQERLAVLYVDLDHFKQINDTLGHMAGDQMLQKITAQMTACLRDADTLARMGGDEFAILMQHLVDSQAAAAVAARLLEVISQPVEIMGLEQTVSASIGICLFPDDGDNTEVLMKHADIAMYRSKSNGRNMVSFFNEDMRKAVDHRADLERRLRQAQHENRLILYYQPMIQSRTNRILALEALLRWDSGIDGLLSADQFLPVAEEIGLGKVFSSWALQQACCQMREWLDSGLIPAGNPCKISVNLSAEQLNQPALVDQVKKVLNQFHLPVSRLIVEVREATLRQEKPLIIENLAKLQEMQIQLILDDFCQGFCTIEKISRLAFSHLKINQMFTTMLLENRRGEALLDSLINLAHILGLHVIAEGIETEMDREWLDRHGCDALQGYLFCRPLPTRAMDLLLKICMKI
ncbi:MAG: EAL domain-containing protein [Clostridiaceae bacterium]|nr:EAL domain-containing protein [Clostridiaceae bacterium]